MFPLGKMVKKHFICSVNPSEPSVHLDQPLTERRTFMKFKKNILKINVVMIMFQVMTPNFVSMFGVLLGLTAGALISNGNRITVLIGVCVYKMRDLADSLDGVLARGVGSAMLPTPGTWGYYIDGWCDIISETALIYSVGMIIFREKTKYFPLIPHDNNNSSHKPSKKPENIVTKFFAPLSISIWGLGVQSIVSAVGWNWTTTQLHVLLEAKDEGPSIGGLDIHTLAAPLCWLVVFLWRLLNPHMLTQALLVSLLLDRSGHWVVMTRYMVTVPIICLCVFSYLLVYQLSNMH